MPTRNLKGLLRPNFTEIDPNDLKQINAGLRAKLDTLQASQTSILEQVYRLTLQQPAGPFDLAHLAGLNAADALATYKTLLGLNPSPDPALHRPAPPVALVRLSDEQWSLVEPLLAASVSPSPSPPRPGRPPAPDRLILDAILWKLRTRTPWSELPRGEPNNFPSHQTCYRRYKEWMGSGLLQRILEALLDDLSQRGQYNPCLLISRLPPAVYNRRVWSSSISVLTGQSWQLATALLFHALLFHALLLDKLSYRGRDPFAF